jgi:HEAT repeat protein
MTQPDISVLVEQLSDRRGRIREGAREALVDLGGPAVPLLLPLAASPSKKLRWEVAKTLGSIADPRAIPALVERLADRESDIRWLAAVGLIRMGPDSIPPVLRALIANPDSTAPSRGGRGPRSRLGFS